MSGSELTAFQPRPEGSDLLEALRQLLAKAVQTPEFRAASKNLRNDMGDRLGDVAKSFVAALFKGPS
jgi:hypothetical protein